MTAKEAFVAGSRDLLGEIERHAPAVRADRHPEHLHRFRVAVRRQRSALSHFCQALDVDSIRPYREGFARLGRATGRLRDLDVDLESRSHLLALVPDALHLGLVPRYQRLARRRERELNHVRLTLNATWYRWLIHDWTRFLDNRAPGHLGNQCVMDLVILRLERSRRRILCHGEDITSTSPDASLHRLRIRCKKLRYLLEFAASLFPDDQVRAVLAHLKCLQDNLGEFNDLSVQWQDWREVLDEAGSATERTAVAALLEVLGARHEAVRGEFEAAFAEFSSSAVAARFVELVGR